MDAVKKDVINLVYKELESANEKFPPFNSSHEGYAVIKEEIEEAEEQLIYTKEKLNVLWSNIKRNNIEFSLAHVYNLEELAINMAVEAIQVAAMAQKYIDSMEIINDEKSPLFLEKVFNHKKDI